MTSYGKILFVVLLLIGTNLYTFNETVDYTTKSIYKQVEDILITPQTVEKIYTNGETDGLVEGYDVGYEDGYKKGFEEGKKETTAFIYAACRTHKPFLFYGLKDVYVCLISNPKSQL